MKSYAWTSDDKVDLKLRPLEHSETIPAHWYTSSDLLKDEVARMFESSWQYVGHVSQLAKAGDHVVIDVLGKPLVLVRQADSSIRCFANVCRHRGGPLATESGSARTLRCRYHAWTYSLEGTLIGAPKFEGVQDFEKSNCRLPEYRLDEYEGFLFVNFDGTAPSLASHLGGIRETVAPTNLQDMRFANRVTYQVKCNWKVYIDNYMEGYHILPVHPSLAKVLDVSGYTTTIEGNKVLQYGPLSGADSPYGTEGAAYYYQIFPNLMFNILPGRVQINSILPIDAHTCLTIFDFFYSERDPSRLAKKMQEDLEFSDLVQQEDIGICEQVQKGLSSGSYVRGRICPSEEKGIWAFQNQLRTAYQGFLK